MKKLLPIAFILCLLFAGCEKENEGPSQIQAATFVSIAYPELVPEQVSTSPAWSYVRQRADVILVDGEPVTDSERATGIMQNIMSGISDTITVARLHSGDLDWWVMVTLTGTSALLEEEALHFDGLIDTLPHDTYNNEYKLVGYSDYCYITYAPDESFEPLSIQLVNYRDFMPNYDHNRQLLDTYINPIALSAAYYDWEDGTLPEGNIMFLFEDLYNLSAGGSPRHTLFTDYPGGRIPYDVVKTTLEQYFLTVPDSALRASKFYDAASGLFLYEGSRGGLTPQFYILDQTTAMMQTQLTYVAYNYYTGEPEGETRRMVIEKNAANDSFIYLSNGPLPPG